MVNYPKSKNETVFIDVKIWIFLVMEKWYDIIIMYENNGGNLCN